MDIETLLALCEVLSNHMINGADCFFGLCTIHGWLDSFSDEKSLPLLELPYGRNHIVLTGPLSAIDQIVYDWSDSLQMTLVAKQGMEPLPRLDPSDSLRREAPNLIWPADHSWFVASEVDFDSTLVGGNATLIDSIVESSTLEAWRVETTDSLADDADKVNRISDD